MSKSHVDSTPGLVGQSIDRIDAREKACGKARYARDLKLPAMLYGATVRSPFPHAIICSIDTSRAMRIPGVRAVITAADVPGENSHGIQFLDQPVLASEKVRYIGDPVVAIAAETEEAAREAAARVEVVYQPLDAVFDPIEALKPEAPKIHSGGNVCGEESIVVGDVEDAFRRSDVIVERDYTTQAIDPMFMEPEAALAYLDEQGNIVLWSPANYVFRHRVHLSRILGIGLHRVRVATPAVGGSFGGRSDLTNQAHAALLAVKTGRPVRISYDLEEGMLVRAKRHPSIIRCRSGASRDGKLLAVQADIIEDTGAYASWGAWVVGCSVSYAMGPYRAEAVDLHGRAVYTNNPISGAVRGFGSQQPNFAYESQMDQLAEALDMDPLDFRMMNIMRPSEPAVDGDMAEASAGLAECLKCSVEVTEWSRKRRLYSGWSDGSRRRGIGVAALVKGFGYAGGKSEQSTCDLQILDDGSAVLRIGSSDTGQGSNTVLAQIAAGELDLPISMITVISGDTFYTPDSNSSGASKQTYLSGNAILDAARKIRETMLETGSSILGVPQEDLELHGETVREKSGGRSVTLVDVIRQAKAKGESLHVHGFSTAPEVEDPVTGMARPKNLFTFGAQIAEVEVDTETGQVWVLNVAAAHDVGKAINPRSVEGQIEGGIQMGLGFALTETLAVKEGAIQAGDLATYLMPIALDMPAISPIIVEAGGPDGPFGAKGIGEAASVPPAAAIVNAIKHATGKRIYSLPATPESLITKE